MTTRLDIARELNSKIHYMNSKSSLRALDVILEEMKFAMARGEDVVIRGLGVWKIRDKRERMGRNPKTGESVVISKRTVCKFHPGKDLKERVDYQVE